MYPGSGSGSRTFLVYSGIKYPTLQINIFGKYSYKNTQSLINKKKIINILLKLSRHHEGKLCTLGNKFSLYLADMV